MRPFRMFVVERFMVLGLSVVGGHAIAAHPLVTDDTSTQGAGRQQAEVNTDWIRQGQDRAHIASFTYSYAPRNDLDVYGNIPFTVSAPSGINDVGLGAKWRFWENTHTSLGIKPELFFPTGDKDKGLGTRRTSSAITLLASHIAGPWTVHGNVGFAAYRYKDPAQREANQRLVWQTSVAAGYQFTERLVLVADTGIARSIQKSVKKDPAFLLVGFIYSPQKNMDLDVGIKIGLNSAEVDRQSGIGYTLRF